ncbi:MAG: NADH-quinone oxidoreductase subunit NuoH [Deltaproteobacteria bacterium]|nr:NADH-quinone oxidoreductase subunit NuoH [Deltaproteobacteria bacterium]
MSLGWVIVIAIIKVVAVMGLILSLTPILIWFERKASAWMQDRMGPNRANVYLPGVKVNITLWGLIHAVADVVKLFSKEDITPANVNKVFYHVGPFITMTVACMTFAVIPLASPFLYGDPASPSKFLIQIADLNVGLLYILAVGGMGIYGLMVAGWASNNKYSMLGTIRSGAQLISYEVAMGLAVMGPILVYGSMRLPEIVEGQGAILWGAGWGFLLQPLACLMFITASFAETNRIPFDLPEGDSELVAGFHLEYSSMKFALFFMGEYTNILVASAFMVCLFFGGYQVPFLTTPVLYNLVGSIGLPLWMTSLVVVGIQFNTFIIKLLFFGFMFIWVRWTLPRFRFDQLMIVGWKYMIPLTLANVVVTGVVVFFMVR